MVKCGDLVENGARHAFGEPGTRQQKPGSDEPGPVGLVYFLLVNDYLSNYDVVRIYDTVLLSKVFY